MRRSHAMAPLLSSDVSELIETCAQLAREREQITRVVACLPDSFAEVRTALTRL